MDFEFIHSLCDLNAYNQVLLMKKQLWCNVGMMLVLQYSNGSYWCCYSCTQQMDLPVIEFMWW